MRELVKSPIKMIETASSREKSGTGDNSFQILKNQNQDIMMAGTVQFDPVEVSITVDNSLEPVTTKIPNTQKINWKRMARVVQNTMRENTTQLESKKQGKRPISDYEGNGVHVKRTKIMTEEGFDGTFKTAMFAVQPRRSQ